MSIKSKRSIKLLQAFLFLFYLDVQFLQPGFQVLVEDELFDGILLPEGVDVLQCFVHHFGVCPFIKEAEVLIHLPGKVAVFDAVLGVHSPGDGDGKQVTAAVEVKRGAVLPGFEIFCFEDSAVQGPALGAGLVLYNVVI